MSSTEQVEVAPIQTEEGKQLPTPLPEQKESSMQGSGKANWKAAKNYYYWHGHEKERAKVGDVAPLPVPVLVTTEAKPTVAASLPSTVKKYSWADGEKNVSIYVEVVEESPAEELEPSSLKVIWKKRSVFVTYTVITSSGVKKNRVLLLHLSNNVVPDSSSHKIKESSKQIYLKAAKETHESWMELTGKPVNDSEEKDSEDE